MGDNSELLETFTSKVDEFETYRTFVGKAQEQADNFDAKVIEAVVGKNTDKSLEVVEDIIPLIMDMEEVVLTLTVDKEETLAGRETSGEKLEELELMKEIGELEEADFESQAKELKESVAAIDDKVAVIDKELDGFNVQLERWQLLGKESGVLEDEDDPPAVEADDDDDGLVIGDDEPIDIVEIDDDEESLESATSGGSEASSSGIEAEDMSVVFGDDDDDDDDGFNLDVSDIDIIGDDEDLEIAGAPDDDEDRPRRAVLLYQEGTAEEQIYPINGDVLTLGRGRDNDVQVKNDSKVSRYHCKVYRRGPNFYVEDNKSANGTLVNGELITERRLFGGEEVIIGETFFRFRIMD